MAHNAKLLGITDERTTCDCCGKTNLKRVAVIDLGEGNIVYYGRDCAAKKLSKSMGTSVDMLVEIRAYIVKWSEKYSDPNIIIKGIWNKFGTYAKFADGQYHIQGIGSI